MKTYTGATGYVYQYYFVGKRQALDDFATEYIFDVSSDRKSLFAVSVYIDSAAINDWGQSHGRALTDPEQYAAAKLRLMQAFDEVENMAADGLRLTVEAEALESLLASLDL
jgi:ubiquinone biosynthesis protein UbiJ